MNGRVGKTLGAIALVVGATAGSSAWAEPYSDSSYQMQSACFTPSESANPGVAFDAVYDAIMNGSYDNPRRPPNFDRDNLLSKLADAASKVNIEKYSNAIDKLQNIIDTANGLTANKPKLSKYSAAVIEAAAENAQLCLKKP